MLPGPLLIRTCPTCDGRFLQPTLASGNTFGATHWTDGWLDAPMLPDSPWLVKCPHCSGFVWLDDDQDLWDEVEADRAARNLPRYVDLKEEDYLAALDSDTADTKEKALYTRERAWWAANDSFRGDEHESDPSLSDRGRSNVEALLTLLSDTNEEQRLMKAELYRELGRFDDAASLLETEFSTPMQPAVKRISDLVRQRRTRVATL